MEGQQGVRGQPQAGAHAANKGVRVNFRFKWIFTLAPFPETCGCEYQSPFNPSSNNEEQLGYDMAPAVVIAGSAIAGRVMGGAIRGASVRGTVSALEDIPKSASGWERRAQAQGFTRSQTPNGPIKYSDESGVVRITIKKGSSRTPGSEGPHVELRNADGQRVDPAGNVVQRRSPENHTPIDWDL